MFDLPIYNNVWKTDKEIRGKVDPYLTEWVWTNTSFCVMGSSLVKGLDDYGDFDIAVYDPHKSISLSLLKDKWEIGGSFADVSEGTDGAFRSLKCKTKKGNTVNIICVFSEKEFQYIKDASVLLSKAQLQDKWHRILLYQYMRNEIPMNAEHFANLCRGVEDPYDTTPF